MSQAAYHLHAPIRRETSVVFASPHSSCDYPPAFLERALPDALAIRSSEDAFVDRLFETAPAHGAPLLLAGAPRAYVDLNRSADELDPALIEGARHHGHNPRIASGLGVIPRVVAGGRTIYDGKIPMHEALGRISSAEIPEGLAAHAAEGVMTLDALKESFPAAARAASRPATADS